MPRILLAAIGAAILSAQPVFAAVGSAAAALG